MPKTKKEPNPLLVIPHDHPTVDEIAAALGAAGAGKRYIQFKYVKQLKTPKTPSALAAKADTIFIGEPDEVRGFLDSAEDVFFAETTKHWCLRLKTMNRKVKTDAGYWSERHDRRQGRNFREKEFQYRTYRLVGIKLETVLVGTNKGKVRIFELQPQVVAGGPADFPNETVLDCQTVPF